VTSLRTIRRQLAVVRRKTWVKTQVFVLEGLLRPVRPPGMVRFGSFYGGWWIDEVDPGRGAAICVGAGTDVTFDLELQRLGYDVHTVDPTPAAVAHVARHAPSLHLVPVGVWTSTGELEFARDTVWNESWMIGATAPAGTAVDQVERFPVSSVKDLVASLGDPPVAVLKLDIEGAEHAVLRSMVADGVRPHCLCVEFDDHTIRKVLASTRLLRRHGYDLWQIEGLNYIFVAR
jgi:FkbM family methyltransferase